MRNHRLCGVVLLCITITAGMAGAAEHLSSLTGVVMGPDGARLPGVVITAYLEETGSTLQTVTNSRGMYLMPHLKAGTYELEAELPGFEVFSMTGLRMAPDVDKIMDINLNLATIREAITVVGSAPRDSIEGSETRESSARDVGEAMTLASGVWMVRKGGIANDIVLRGFQSKDINVLIDGQRIYGACPNNMDPPAFHVDFAEVDRIEIGKGAFDIKNQGSLGGVINIVTRNAEHGFHSTGNLSTGSYGFVNPAATVSYGRETFSLLGGYSYRSSSPYTDGTGKLFTEYVNYRSSNLESDAFRAGTAWGKASFNPFPNQLVQFSYTRQQADHVLYPYLMMDAVYDDTDRLSAGYRIDGISDSIHYLKLHAYYTQVKHWMTDEYRTSSISFPREYSMGTFAGTEAVGGKLETELRDFTLGLELYHREWTGTTRLAGAGYAPQYSIPDVRTDNAGLYFQYLKPFSDSVKLVVGGRVDTVTTAADSNKANTDLYFAYNSTRTVSKTNNYPSGSVHLSYRTPAGIELRGGVGHTVRVPDARERYFTLKRMGTDWVGNPDLEPSRNTGLDTAISYQHRGLLLETSLYLNSVNDYVTVVPAVKMNALPGIMNSNARSYQNVNARIYGSDFLVSYLIRKQVFFSGDLSYVRGTTDVRPEIGVRAPDMAEIPPLRSRMTLRYDTSRITAEIEGVFAGAQKHVDDALGEQRTAGYGIANFKIGIHIQKLAVRLALNNLLGRSYFEHLSYQRDPFRSGTRVYEPGRNFFINISYRY